MPGAEGAIEERPRFCANGFSRIETGEKEERKKRYNRGPGMDKASDSKDHDKEWGADYGDMLKERFPFARQYQRFILNFFGIQPIGFVIVNVVDSINIAIGRIQKKQEEDDNRNGKPCARISAGRRRDTHEVGPEFINPKSWSANSQQSLKFHFDSIADRVKMVELFENTIKRYTILSYLINPNMLL